VLEANLLSDAVVAWTGYGEATAPTRDDDRVRQRFGAAEAERLLQIVRAVEEECWASKAHLTAPDLTAMATAAAAHIHERFPRLREDAIEAVVWAYTFDNR
jgi:hypothetical protein